MSILLNLMFFLVSIFFVCPQLSQGPRAVPPCGQGHGCHGREADSPQTGARGGKGAAEVGCSLLFLYYYFFFSLN